MKPFSSAPGAASLLGAGSVCRPACGRYLSAGPMGESAAADAQHDQAPVSTLNQVEQQVRDIEDIPQGLMSQVNGLINQATQNPLTGITTNLSGLFNGSGTGSCVNSANLLRLNQFATATGGDFTGSWINGAASITSGLQACNQMVLQSTQTSLNDLPQLGQQLQACKDMACATAVSGRIQVETANLNAQSLQLTAMANAGQLQQYTAQMQFQQKMRANPRPLQTAPLARGRQAPGQRPFPIR